MALQLMLESSRKARILVVDDEPEIREVLCDLLSADYLCDTAGSGEEALSLLEDHSFDLIISDIMMNHISGLDLVPRVLSFSPHTVIILISGIQTIESAISALRAGAFDYIMKPFDLSQVEIAVHRALEHQSLLLAKERYENQLEALVAQRTLELDHALSSLEDAYRSTLKALTSALETRDAETHGHSERVVTFSLRLGEEYGLEKEEMKSLEFGSLLHDIGKIGVPDAILRKPAQLSEREWEQMREHPLHGEQILVGIEFLRGAAKVVAEHHERWDGSGYPKGLKGAEIDVKARIFQVADAFDAITSDRVYRRGKSYEEAREELRRWAGRQFDPEVVEAFERVPEEEWFNLRVRSLINAEEQTDARSRSASSSLHAAQECALALQSELRRAETGRREISKKSCVA